MSCNLKLQNGILGAKEMGESEGVMKLRDHYRHPAQLRYQGNMQLWSELKSRFVWPLHHGETLGHSLKLLTPQAFYFQSRADAFFQWMWVLRTFCEPSGMQPVTAPFSKHSRLRASSYVTWSQRGFRS